MTLGACRFGGPSGDPTAYSGDASAVGGSSGQAGSGGEGGSSGTGGSGASGGSGATGGATGGVGATGGATGGANPGGAGGATIDASSDGFADDAADARPRDDSVSHDAIDDIAVDGESDGAPPTGCVPPFMSTVCDPVCNTGCPALLRCDITVDLPRTGVCVGTLLSTAGEGMPCTRSTVTDDCLDRLTCFEATCRRLCYRDTDCTAVGTCCSMSIELDGGASGYRVCAPCGP
ncbi:MAG: hypothetical protein ABW133_17215 [Polyangiaceae bacterium]